MAVSITRPQRRLQRAGEYFTELWNRREFAWFMAIGNLQARNASTSLGLLWWVLNPLLLGFVYYLIFGLLFPGNRGENYVGYLLSGMFVFHFTAQAMTGGANSILQNSRLLANLRFPRLILPIAHLIESAIGFLASLVVLYAIIGPLEGTWPSASTLMLVVIFPVHLLFCLGLAAITARLAVPFRDVNNLIPYLSRIWLYLSPVIWRPQLLEGAGPVVQWLITLNPMYQLIAVYRTALLGDPFLPGSLGASALWALAVGIVGVGLFVKYEGRMVRYL